MATVGGFHVCSPPTVYEQGQEVGPLWTCSCGRRFELEHFYAEDGRWIGAFFDVAPDGRPSGRRMR